MTTTIPTNSIDLAALSVAKPGGSQAQHLLPIAKPLIISYAHHAFPLAIALTDPRSQEYLLFNFLQLHTRYSKLHKEIRLDFFVQEGHVPKCPFVIRSHIDRGQEITDICATTSHLLHSGYYVEIGLDERLLKMKASFGASRSFNHTSLIYGIDQAAGVFYAQGFVANGAYQDFRLSFADVRAAFDGTLRPLSIVQNYSWPPKAQLHGLAKRYLMDYLDGDSSFEYPDLLLRNPRNIFERWKKRELIRSNNLFGRKIFSFLYRKLERESCVVRDIRPWCLIWEHKQRLLALGHYLRAGRNDEQLTSALRGVADGFFSLRNDMMEAWYQRSPIKTGDLRKRIDALLAAEEPVIRQMIALL